MTANTLDANPLHPLRAPYAPPDEEVAARLLGAAPRAPVAEARIDARATHLIEGIRARSGGLGGIEGFLPAHLLSTPEGLALMGLAGGLRRGAGAAPADRLVQGQTAK